MTDISVGYWLYAPYVWRRSTDADVWQNSERYYLLPPKFIVYNEDGEEQPYEKVYKSRKSWYCYKLDVGTDIYEIVKHYFRVYTQYPLCHDNLELRYLGVPLKPFLISVKKYKLDEALKTNLTQYECFENPMDIYNYFNFGTSDTGILEVLGAPSELRSYAIDLIGSLKPLPLDGDYKAISSALAEYSVIENKIAVKEEGDEIKPHNITEWRNDARINLREQIREEFISEVIQKILIKRQQLVKLHEHKQAKAYDKLWDKYFSTTARNKAAIKEQMEAMEETNPIVMKIKKITDEITPLEREAKARETIKIPESKLLKYVFKLIPSLLMGYASMIFTGLFDVDPVLEGEEAKALITEEGYVKDEFVVGEEEEISFEEEDEEVLPKEEYVPDSDEEIESTTEEDEWQEESSSEDYWGRRKKSKGKKKKEVKEKEEDDEVKEPKPKKASSEVLQRLRPRVIRRPMRDLSDDSESESLEFYAKGSGAKDDDDEDEEAESEDEEDIIGEEIEAELEEEEEVEEEESEEEAAQEEESVEDSVKYESSEDESISSEDDVAEHPDDVDADKSKEEEDEDEDEEADDEEDDEDDEDE